MHFDARRAWPYFGGGGEGGVFAVLWMPGTLEANMFPHATPDHNGKYCYDTPTAAVQNCAILTPPSHHHSPYKRQRALTNT